MEVCPHVLKTVVRLCLVDRGTDICQFVDFGPGTSLAERPSATEVKSAALLTTADGGLQPDIFLLFKPGHYDILVRSESRVARLLEPCVGLSTLAGDPSVSCRNGDILPLTEKLCAHFTSLLHFIEERLTEELATNARGRDLALLEGMSLENNLFSFLIKLIDLLLD